METPPVTDNAVATKDIALIDNATRRRALAAAWGSNPDNPRYSECYCYVGGHYSDCGCERVPRLQKELRDSRADANRHSKNERNVLACYRELVAEKKAADDQFSMLETKYLQLLSSIGPQAAPEAAPASPGAAAKRQRLDVEKR